MPRNQLSRAIRSVLVCSAVGVLPTQGRSQPEFSAHDISLTADFAWSVSAADVDGDGDIDVLSASYADNKIAWYENDGRADPKFFLRTISTAPGGPHSIFAGDLDGDGDIDAVSALGISDAIVWYENDGSENFSIRTIATNTVSAFAVSVADVDGDGHLDVLSASYDDKIAWYENDGAADPTFLQHIISTNANVAYSVLAADVDGDGDMDVLSASSQDEKVAWYENDGSENFTPRIISTNASGAHSVFAADLNGNGFIDVISASRNDDKVAWYENDGSENFAEHVITTNADIAFEVFGADVDGDGDVDVLSASGGDDKVVWYENDGSGSFTARTVATSADGAIHVHAADLDGDGDVDVLSASFYDDKVAWYENDGRNFFAPFSGVKTISATANGPQSVFAIDLDRDGDADALSASFADDKIAWYRNDGNQGFLAITIATNADSARSVFAIDVDGDGDIDVLSASATDNKIAWYENNGNQAFSLITIATSASSARSVFAIDLDRDGDLDVLSASFDDDKIAWYDNDGSQSFALKTITTSADGARSVFAIDLDRDGDVDVLSASQQDDKIAWYDNDGSQVFTAAIITTLADGAVSVFASDVDNDGDIDVLSASAIDQAVRWYENDGNQGFASRTIAVFPNFGNATSVLAADLDLDGDMDIVSAADGVPDLIVWHQNEGDGIFRFRTVVSNVDGPGSVAAADLDGDGDLDLLSASRNDALIGWFENRVVHRTGAFDSTRTVTTSADVAFSVFAADVDGDGDTDVLSASREDDKIAWYENDGAQNFKLRTIATSADGAYAVVAADLDGDGHIDVVSASANDDKIAWYKNDGSQGFTLRTIATNADSAYAIFVADVDTDGDLDVLSASWFDDKVSWHENTAGTFSEHTITTTADEVRSVFAIDLDRDGDTDVLSAAAAANTIAWYQNDGSQSFAMRTITTNAFAVLSIFATDVDGDGDVDVAFVTNFDDTIGWYENNGSQVFSPRTVATNAEDATSVFASDVDGDGDIDLLSASDGYDDKIAWYENDGTQTFTLRTITTGAIGARSVVAADVDDDGDIDVLSASLAEDKIAWYENCGGQFLFSGGPFANPTIFDGDVIELLALDFLHNGRAGDSSAELDSIALQFTDSSGNPLNTAQINDRIDELRVYLDDGSGSFEAADDTLLATVSDPEVTPRALTRGVISVPFADDAVVVVAPNGSAELFVVADVAAGASGAPAFQVRLHQAPPPRSQAADDSSGSVLSLECARNAASAVIDPLPAVDLSVSAGSGTEDAMTVITVTATATSAVSGDQTVDVSAGGTGITSGDFSLSDDDGGQSGSQIMIPDGMISGSVTFTVQDDLLLEPEETATLTISNPSAGIALGTTTTQDVVITDNDVASLAIADVTLNEGDSGTTTFTVVTTLTGAVQDSFSVPFSVTAGTATGGGVDYNNTSGNLSFSGSDGETQSFDVDVVGDSVVELDETFTPRITTPSNTLVGISDSEALATITNDDSANIGISNLSAGEGNSGTSNFTFTATLDAAVDTALSVDFSTSDDTAAVADGDYTAASGTLNFAGNAGEQQTLAVVVIGDTKVENSETFTVNLSNVQASGRNVSAGSATGTITNDDASGVTVADVAADEAAGMVSVVVTLDRAVQGGFSVDYATSDDSALAGSDYTAASGTLNFAGNAGETQSFDVTIEDDALLEGDEQLFVNLSNIQGASNVTINDATGVVTVNDNDAALLAIGDVTLDEGNSGTTVFTFTTTLTGAVQDSFTVPYSLSSGSATAGTDYTNVSDTLSFNGADGETHQFSVDVVADSVVELDESFVAQLGSPSNALVTLGDGSASGTITNDDAATLSIDDVAVNEGDIGVTNFTFTVTLNRSVDTQFDIDYATSDMTAIVADGDYTAAADTLTFGGSAGESRTITVAVSGDTVVEADETFTTGLSNIQASGRDVSLSRGSGTATIVNDDVSEVDLSRDGATLADGGTDDLGFVQLGVSTLTYTIDSSGNATASIGIPTFSNPVNVTNLTLATAPASTVPGGQATTFDVSFETLAIGPFSFDLSFDTNDLNENPYDITVSGSVPDTVLSAELAPPILLVDNDADGIPNPSDTARFGVLLRNNGDPAAGEVRFDFTAPAGTIVTRANRSVDGTISNTDQTITATFNDLEGGGREFPDIITFDLLIDNEVAADVLSVQGKFSFGGETILTDDPNVVGADNPTLVPIGILSRLLATDPSGLFGESAAISESFMAVAAPGADGGAGSVRIYRILSNGNREFLREVELPPDFAGQNFGATVAIDGDTLVIGSMDDPTAAKGASGNKVAIYRLNPSGNEELLAQITGNLQSGFGSSVAIDGDTVIVGAPEEDEGSMQDVGAVYTYSLSNLMAGATSPQRRIVPTSPASDARFGAAIACANNKIVIGAPGPLDSVFLGSASIYDNLTGNLSGLELPQESIGQFGRAVAIEGGRVIIGAPKSPGGGGIFEYDTAGVRLSGKITGADTGEGNEFGRSVAIDDGELYVGAPQALTAGTDGEGNFGAVYRFIAGQQMEKIGAFSESSGTFQQQEAFGAALAVKNGALVIGAPESENQKGAAAFRQGNPADTIFSDSFED